MDDLASKYAEARGKVDEEIKAEQEKVKGLVDKAEDAIGGAIDTILKLKALFTGLLANAASAFNKILDDPIAFISNFMSAGSAGDVFGLAVGTIGVRAPYSLNGLKALVRGQCRTPVVVSWV